MIIEYIYITFLLLACFGWLYIDYFVLHEEEENARLKKEVEYLEFEEKRKDLWFSKTIDDNTRLRQALEEIKNGTNIGWIIDIINKALKEDKR